MAGNIVGHFKLERTGSGKTIAFDKVSVYFWNMAVSWNNGAQHSLDHIKPLYIIQFHLT